MADKENKSDDLGQKHAPSKVSLATGEMIEGEFDDVDKDYLYILGDAFLQAGHFGKAEIIFQFIEDVFQSDVHARKCKAFTFLMQERYQEALELVMELKQNKLEDVSLATLSLIAARAYHNLGKADEAQGAMEDFIELRKAYMADMGRAENVNG